jgi:hypothetical protein
MVKFFSKLIQSNGKWHTEFIMIFIKDHHQKWIERGGLKGGGFIA